MKNYNILTIILNWNNTKDSLECLDSLDHSEIKTDILIIDNGSKKNNLINLKKGAKKYQNLKIIENKFNHGFAAGNNQGMQYAIENNYEYVLLLNNDTVVNKNFLNILLEEFINRKNIGIAAPKIYYYNSNKIWHTGGKINKYTAKANGLYLQNATKPVDVGFDFLSGCCMLIKTSALEKIGLFNEKYFAYLEDAELCKRALQNGYKLLYVPEAKIWHKVSQSLGGSAFGPMPLFLRTRNRIIYQKESAGFIASIIFFFYHSIFVCFFILCGLVTLNLKISKAVILGYLYGYFNNLEFPNI